jgi:hypothetical protein
VQPPPASVAPAPAPTPAVAPVVRSAHAKLVETHGAKVAGWIEKQEVHNGMTTSGVLAARGNPSARDAVTADVEVWTYGAQKIVFTKGKVTSIGK